MQTLATRCVIEGSFSMKSMDSMHPAKHQIIMKDISQSLSWGRIPQNTGYGGLGLKRVPMAGATGFHPWSASTRQRPRITQSNRLHIDFQIYPLGLFGMSWYRDLRIPRYPKSPDLDSSESCNTLNSLCNPCVQEITHRRYAEQEYYVVSCSAYPCIYFPIWKWNT